MLNLMWGLEARGRVEVLLDQIEHKVRVEFRKMVLVASLSVTVMVAVYAGIILSRVF